jgi:quercetin dioxygenase-like cupin family protein
MLTETLTTVDHSVTTASARKAHPHTITSGTGEELTFLRIVRVAGEERLEVENCIQPNAGPPMHAHYLQEEALTIKQGKVGYQVFGEPARYAEKGETVKFPAGVAHRFWNAGMSELRCVGYIEPVNNFEYILSAIFDSMKANKRERPGLFDTAFLLTRYRSELGMLDIPWAVQKFVFPVLIAIGSVFGFFAKFKDAPTPVTGVKAGKCS